MVGAQGFHLLPLFLQEVMRDVGEELLVGHATSCCLRLWLHSSKKLLHVALSEGTLRKQCQQPSTIPWRHVLQDIGTRLGQIQDGLFLHLAGDAMLQGAIGLRENESSTTDSCHDALHTDATREAEEQPRQSR